MKKKTMTITAAIITGALTIAMAATVMAAPQSNEGNGPRGGNGGPMQGGGQGFEMQQRPGEGERPNFPDGEKPEFSEGERPELPDGEMPQFEEGERPELPEGEQSGRPGEMRERGKGMKGINTDGIKTAIETLEDDDVKSELEDLFSAYEEAKAALDAAMESKDDDLESYRTAELDAMKALMEALEEAGIDTRPELPEGEEGNEPESDNNEDQEGRQIIRQDQDNGQQGGRAMQNRGNDQLIRTHNAASDDDSVESAFAKIVNWFKSFLS